MNDNTRIRPYLDYKIVVLLERLREIQGLSLGKILTTLLHDSKTFQVLIENYYEDDEILNNIFLGLPIDEENCNNTKNQQKEQ